MSHHLLNVDELNSLDIILRNSEFYRELLYFLEQFNNTVNSSLFSRFIKVLEDEVYGPPIYNPNMYYTYDDYRNGFREPNSKRPYHFTADLIQNARLNIHLNEILHKIIDMFYNRII